jgi:hypothetical protein
VSDDLKLRPSRIWRTHYKGIGIEVAHHAVSPFQPHGIWCGYLYICEEHDPSILERRGTSKDYGIPGFPVRWTEKSHPFWDEFEWNGGITYYSETTDLRGKVTMQIGCDYAHIWDDDKRDVYDENWILNDMVGIVDAYRKIVPETEPVREIVPPREKVDEAAL